MVSYEGPIHEILMQGGRSMISYKKSMMPYQGRETCNLAASER